MKKFKSGFVAVLGRPNVGKSSLVNSFIGFKVSIISSTPQTTKNQIKGIYTTDEMQIVFIDTPGIHKPQQKLGEYLNKQSYSSLKDSEWILFLTPINDEIGKGDKLIIEKLNLSKTAAIISKIDESNEKDVIAKVEKLKELGFQDVLAYSVSIPESKKALEKYLKEKLPEGVSYFPEDEITDKNLRFIASETIRESAINFTSQEIPHSIGVRIEVFKEPENEGEKYHIEATIFVERESQKGILVGKNGSMIKKISTDARIKLKNELNHPVFLKNKVKVKKNWTNKPDLFKELGYN
ncbi:MAG: GTPase Era [Mollicutes bacterium PWAP]|nr:GTPase Era [Mollicutes bacterium PWAP]